MGTKGKPPNGGAQPPPRRAAPDGLQWLRSGAHGGRLQRGLGGVLAGARYIVAHSGAKPAMTSNSVGIHSGANR